MLMPLKHIRCLVFLLVCIPLFTQAKSVSQTQSKKALLKLYKNQNPALTFLCQRPFPYKGKYIQWMPIVNARHYI